MGYRIRNRPDVAVGIWLILASGLAGQTRQTPNVLKLDKKENMPKAGLADLAWLAGHWSGPGLGGTCEEIWSPQLGDNMIGMFRLMKDGKTAFTEFFSLVAEGESLVLKLKHFGPQLKGWEEKDQTVDFALVKLSESEANFDGLTIRRESDGGLATYVVFKGKDGSLREEVIRYHRVTVEAPRPTKGG